jgi:hypothetical protein
MRNITGRTITSTNTMTTTPITGTFLPHEGPGFDLDERANGELGHCDG